MQSDQRIRDLDAVRGVALCGILLVNAGLFAFPALYLNPMDYWTDPVNRSVIFLTNFIGEGKFIAMFSFLFGLGFTIFLQGAVKKGLHPVRLFLRRLAVLLGIGIMHAYFIWFGDVLCLYSVLGVALLFFRNCRPQTLLIWAFCLLTVPVVIFVGGGMLTGPGIFADPSAAVTTALGKGALHIYRTGSWLDIWRQNSTDVVSTRIGYLLVSPVIFAMFLLGAYAGKKNIFRDIAGNMPLIRQVQLWGAVTGWPLALLSACCMNAAPDSLVYNYTQVMGSYLGGPAIALFYMATVVRFLRHPAGRRILQPFEAAGRMAATNYLMQSVGCVLVYYSFGLGWYGRSPLTGWLVWICVFSLQLLLSSWWMRRFRSGPVEWLWRRLTYGRLAPEYAK
ncbi:DUF418 domain-containing protein [Chitinophaga solisilvae]|uniref:DUF418 domain-containing protein n=1 Tax=Chitinophaga solisilvae TaxID=1233460 RepID=UPI001368757E|nr:DUF418 domain-containing protein [Chitinophaga solisilvae]